MRALFAGNFHSQFVGTRSSAEELSDALQSAGVEIVTTSRYRRALPKVFDMVLTTMRRRSDYDVAVVDVYSGRAFRWAEAVCAILTRSSRPFIANLVGGELPILAERQPARLRRMLNRATAVTAPSRYIVEAVEHLRGDVEILPSHGIHLERYPFRLRSTCRARLVWLRAFHEIYAPLNAVRVLEAVLAEESSAELRMVGPDKLDGSAADVREYATAHGLTDALHLVGPVDKADVPSQLDWGDVFLNTTRAESLGVSMLEAMACGMCVVSTDVGAVSDLVTDGIDGLLVAPDDPEAMAAAVRRLLASPELSSSISANARSKAEGFAWWPTTVRWLDLLERVAGDAA